ncbi:hypothetical protein FDV58_29420 [Bradyrhizobium elkanii]|uniref:Uncharacterized protein n=1 Tax=Bradyrhizobium elkanii TaxID=29448 RepID=A0A4U6RSB2_BRAEL|nr:hypothetical protein [Bradyrhizobium elkanii]TKV77729.1 hypothetical protein FDV58_29420 [Bradyrhizobium elkanii]
MVVNRRRLSQARRFEHTEFDASATVCLGESRIPGLAQIPVVSPRVMQEAARRKKLLDRLHIIGLLSISVAALALGTIFIPWESSGSDLNGFPIASAFHELAWSMALVHPNELCIAP